MDDFIKKFKITELKIKEFEHWVVSLRPKQVTIGSLVLSLKRECPSFAQLNTEESTELKIVFSYVEEVLKKKLGANKINYLALMMIDNQVHYHIIPRYDHSVNFKGQKYQDKNWPVAPDISMTLDMDNEDLLLIKNELLKNEK